MRFSEFVSAALGGLLGGDGSTSGMDRLSQDAAVSQEQQSRLYHAEIEAMDKNYSGLSNSQKAMHDSVLDLLKDPAL
jgi:hypothetical protein